MMAIYVEEIIINKSFKLKPCHTHHCLTVPISWKQPDTGLETLRKYFETDNNYK